MVASNDLKAYLPTTKKELQLRGWDEVDVIIFSGDAYIDHPAFGAAVIGRVLEHAGYKVAIVPQPDWRGDHRDFTKLGKPRLFFAITAGSMDSMVNHYTAAKRLRSDDAYTPDGKAGMRPDYCTITYSNILRQLYPDIPIVIGGVEASMRRLTHYDYWSDKLMPSILVDSKADILVYGMGEKQVLAIARCLEDASKRLQDGSKAAYSLEDAPEALQFRGERRDNHPPQPRRGSQEQASARRELPNNRDRKQQNQRRHYHTARRQPICGSQSALPHHDH